MFSQYFEDGEARLIQCFINTDFMVSNPEKDTAGCEYEEDKDETERALCKRDPLYEWFRNNVEGKWYKCTSFWDLDSFYTDVELLYCIANLTAVIMACPRRNNHLWYHLYALHELRGTYIPSFMVCLHNTILMKVS